MLLHHACNYLRIHHGPQCNLESKAVQHVGKLDLSMLPDLLGKLTMLQCCQRIYLWQVPNALSFGGASLVCSCTVVLGLAEQMPASSLRADGHRQPQTWQNMCLLVDCCLDRLYVFGSKIRGVWSRNIGQQDHYEHVAQDELVNDI